MKIIEMLLKEMDQEAKTTRKMLERIPEDKYNWQPHPKSMTMVRLATHIAELPGWVKMAFTTDELNFAANDYKPTVVNNNAEVLALFEKSLAEGRSALETGTEEQMEKNWVMRNGDQIYASMTKAELIRTAFCQTVHHRAQLGVFLRLLDIPIPGSYGPSADDNSFQ
jgi:uncharacterized damage-inducible protein DinB